MLMTLVLTVLIVGLVLVGFKLIWADELDDSIDEPPTTTGHLNQGWPKARTHAKA